MKPVGARVIFTQPTACPTRTLSKTVEKVRVAVSKSELILPIPVHQTMSVALGAILGFVLCVLAALRLCVKILLHG